MRGKFCYSPILTSHELVILEEMGLDGVAVKFSLEEMGLDGVAVKIQKKQGGLMGCHPAIVKVFVLDSITRG